VSGFGTGPWQEAAAGLGDGAVSGVLIVQCGLDWLRPGLAGLRDEIDEAVMAALLARDDLVVDRLVPRNLPVLGEAMPGELVTLNDAHAEWLYRLAVAGALLAEGRRARVHRLIVEGGQARVDAVDGIVLRVDGAWSDPDAAAAVLAILDRPGATRPLTGYDIEMDGPYGDADPSVYL
jgi:hypothetical protein